ncbi:MAG TPA: DUF1800 domain-containing protein [Vicinamibacterales bacterium]|jgi:uncharacterized protein (DUF1800 family)|nr:DUF1800 domain-containing protein [Vicinamibacterales bacterium]
MKSLIAPAFRRAAPALLTAAVVVAPLAADKPKSAVPPNPDDRTITHVLNRIGFGARTGDVERVRQIGLRNYIEQQLRPDRISDSALEPRLAGFETLDKSSRDIAEHYFEPAMRARRQAKAANAASDPEDGKPMRTPEQMAAGQKERQVLQELSEQKILRAVYSDRQLEEVMTDFWFNHFNVFAGKGATPIYLTEYEREVIRPHVLGKFRDLLGATAKSPAMLFYLDNWQSADPDAPALGERLRQRAAMRRAAGTARRPEPFPAASGEAGQQPRQKRGLNENYGRELMELHTLGVDGGYTQQDVVEVARCFTGWTIRQPRQGGGFVFEPRIHDNGRKLVLGHVISGGGEHDGEQVLDILARHPATAHFIATKLVRKFVSDDPPAELVDRAAARFRETDGDIREVVRTIITSPEFFAAGTYRAKVKTPFEFVVSTVRATGSDVQNAAPLAQSIRQLGEPLYMCQPPTGYADRADAWVNTGALLNRMNFAVQLVGGRIRGIEPSGLALDSAAAARDQLVGGVLAADLSTATSETVAKAQDPRQAAALILGSPEFQRR